MLTGIGVIVRGEFPDKLTSVDNQGLAEQPRTGETMATASPNPVKRGNQLRLYIANAETNGSACAYTVFDTRGQILLEENSVSLTTNGTESELFIKTEGLPVGQYFVRVQTKAERSYKSSFIVVE